MNETLVEVSLLLEKEFGENISIQVQECNSLHLVIKIISDKFTNLTKLERQRHVMSLLQKFFTSGKLHAVQLKLITDNES